jgi:acyl dehydratase
MPLDYHRLKSLPPARAEQAWTAQQTILYALGVGAMELPFVYEKDLRALPTMCAILAAPPLFTKDNGFGLDLRRILHIEQSLEIHAPIPVAGNFTGESRFDRIVDKGENAIIHTSRRIFDEEGTHFATAGVAIMARGGGGFGGGDPAPPVRPFPLDAPPDLTVRLPTAANQAMLYRLSGDRNPLHIDPAMARVGGFERPILHGMCSYGIAGRALIAALCGNDPAGLKSMQCRFSAPVFPGETIRTEIWRAGGGSVRFRAVVEGREVAVLTQGFAQLH